MYVYIYIYIRVRTCTVCVCVEILHQCFFLSEWSILIDIVGVSLFDHTRSRSTLYVHLSHLYQLYKSRVNSCHSRILQLTRSAMQPDFKLALNLVQHKFCGGSACCNTVMWHEHASALLLLEESLHSTSTKIYSEVAARVQTCVNDALCFWLKMAQNIKRSWWYMMIMFCSRTPLLPSWLPDNHPTQASNSRDTIRTKPGIQVERERDKLAAQLSYPALSFFKVVHCFVIKE